jgi:hypothetical protein
MYFNGTAIRRILNRKGISYLYHANTVKTASNFLVHGALLSRRKVEKMGLYQTEQYTDELDKEYKIYNSVFLDSCDIHDRGNLRNDYGPVLFKIDMDILQSDNIGEVSITKVNPSNWPNLSRSSDRWFQSINEIQDSFGEFDFGQMIVFRRCKGKIDLSGYLEEVIIDDPRRRSTGGIDYFSSAFGSLKSAYFSGGLEDVGFIRRRYISGCLCHSSYERLNLDSMKKLFTFGTK